MATISQTTISNAFSWTKMFKFRFRFHWRLFLRFELAMFQHWFWWWLGVGQATSHCLNRWWLVYWRIYASLGLNGFITYTLVAVYIADLRELLYATPQNKCTVLWCFVCGQIIHYDDVIMSTIASQITSLTIVYSTIYSGADQSKHQSSASLAFVWGIHRNAENVSIWWRHHVFLNGVVVTHSRTFFMVTSQARGQSYDTPSASEIYAKWRIIWTHKNYIYI